MSGVGMSSAPAAARAVTATVLALTANLALLAAGRAGGASFAVPDRSDPGALLQIGPTAVTLSTVLPLLVGLVVAALLTRRWPRARVALKVIAIVITLASLGMPLTVDTDTGTRLLLAAMHLVVGVAYLAALGRGRPDSAAHADADTEAAAAGSSR